MINKALLYVSLFCCGSLYALNACYETEYEANYMRAHFEQQCVSLFGGGATFYGSVNYVSNCAEQ